MFGVGVGVHVGHVEHKVAFPRRPFCNEFVSAIAERYLERLQSILYLFVVGGSFKRK